MKSHESYIDVVKRLKIYRSRLGLSQNEMGNILGVTQSHYYKLEKGLKILSKKSLLRFLAAGQDVFWLLTGKEANNKVFEKHVAEHQMERGLGRMLEIYLWATNEGVRILQIENEDSLYKALRMMKICNSYDRAIWTKIREAENLTQVEMAEILDINIKRYRRIEKGENEEDGEIISSLYVNLGYSPMIILDRDRYCLDEMDIIWDKFNEPLKHKLFEYIDAGWEIVKCESV